MTALTDDAEEGPGPVLRPARRLGDHLYEALTAMIDSRELADGTRLPAENELAQQFGVSRPTVRETLSRLRDEGLIVSRRGSGSYVQRREPVATALRRPEFGKIDSFEQIEKCYEFRKAIEGDACFLAATRRTEAQLSDIRQALSALGHLTDTGAVGGDIDFQFHLTLARGAGNEWFVSALLAMREQIEFIIEIARSLSLGRSAERRLTIQAEHVAIVTAIEEGDPDKARAAIREHLANTRDRIFKGL